MVMLKERKKINIIFITFKLFCIKLVSKYLIIILHPPDYFQRFLLHHRNNFLHLSYLQHTLLVIDNWDNYYVPKPIYLNTFCESNDSI